jgi:hypothetical protein
MVTVVNGLTKERMLKIEGMSIVDARIAGDDLILISNAGEEINVGNVRGKQGEIPGVEPGEDSSFRVVDLGGGVALIITDLGRTRIGDLEEITTSDSQMTIGDKGGYSAFRVTPEGTIYMGDYRIPGYPHLPREIHVFLAAGQSNMAGTGYPLDPDLDIPNPRIWQFGATVRQLEIAPVPLDYHSRARGLSPATVFARKYLETVGSHVSVLIVPAAHSGTPMGPHPTAEYNWDPDAASGPEYDLYSLSVKQLQDAMAAAGPLAKLKGVIWHQGEGNSGIDTVPESYAARLDRLISDYRRDFGRPDLPFVVGQLSQSNIASGRIPINKAHVQTPARVYRTGFAPSVIDGNNFEDGTHQSRIGLEYMGQKFMEGYYRALINVPATDPLPPPNVSARRRPGNAYYLTWDQPLCRVSEYRMETRVEGGSWTPVNREWGMSLNETIVASVPTEVRVISVSDAKISSPSTSLMIG